jgi:hypothetical protein
MWDSGFYPYIRISEVSLEHHLFNLYIAASIRDRISMIDRFISQSVPFGCRPPASLMLRVSLPCLHKYATPLFVQRHSDNFFSMLEMLLVCVYTKNKTLFYLSELIRDLQFRVIFLFQRLWVAVSRIWYRIYWLKLGMLISNIWRIIRGGGALGVFLHLQTPFWRVQD